MKVSSSFAEIRRKVLFFLADGLSHVFHPIFYLIYTYALFSSQENPVFILHLLQLVFLFALLPILLIYLYHPDLHLKDRKTRFFPLMLVGLGQALLLAWQHYFPFFALDPIFVPLLWVQLLGSLVLILVNLKIKASLHTFAATAYAIWLVVLFENSLSIAIAAVLLFLVIWARLYTKAHQVSEIIAGLFCGLLCGSLLPLLMA